MNYRIVLKANSEYPGSLYRRWWWVLKSAGNGAILATSETYTTKAKALKTAADLAQVLDIEVRPHVTFIFKCSKGHKVEVTEDEAEAFNGTACQVCYRPLLVAGVKS